MSAVKRLGLIALLLGSFAAVAPQQADAGIFFRRVAPVRRAVLPPYPVARRVVAGPVYRRPYYRPYGYGWGGPGFYGPGVSVGVGIY